MKDKIDRIKEYIGALPFYIFRLFPIKSNKIVIVNYLGKGYGDNAKYITEELINRKEKLDIVWLVNKVDELFPKEVRTVKYGSIKAIYELVTAKIWIDNRRKPSYVRKRKNQYYIMTWHAGITLKKVEKDAEQTLPTTYIRAAKADSKMADLFLSSSRWDTECYRRAFWYDGRILEKGLPRQDIIFNLQEESKANLKNKIGIDTDYNTVLYAPTFRKNMTESDLSVYSLDWKKLLSELELKFGGKWKGLIRLHPNVSKFTSLLNLPDDVLNVTDYPDMQELIAIADIGITDYSSALLEFGMTGRPSFIFATDYAEYKKDRDLNFTLEELPCSFAANNKELLENIRSFENDNYLKKIREFYYNRCGLFQGGKSSQYVADIILNEIKK
jgi:CDP-glycerol glycerophosphotransferase